MQIYPVWLESEIAADSMGYVIDQEFACAWNGQYRLIDDPEEFIEALALSEIALPAGERMRCFSQHRSGNPALVRMAHQSSPATGRELA